MHVYAVPSFFSDAEVTDLLRAALPCLAPYLLISHDNKAIADVATTTQQRVKLRVQQERRQYLGFSNALSFTNPHVQQGKNVRSKDCKK